MVKLLRTDIARTLCVAAVLSFTVLFWGCGKKGWPEPRLDEDRFHWAQIQHQRYDDCLDVRALLGGAASNLRFVVLEWMALRPVDDIPDSPSLFENAEDNAGDDSLEIPFKTTGRVRLDDSSAEFKRQNGVIRILYCGLEPDISYRWRLVGRNKYTGLEPSISQVQFSQ